MFIYNVHAPNKTFALKAKGMSRLLRIPCESAIAPRKVR